MDSRISLGKLGEKYAKRYLWWRGYRVLTQNYRRRAGEVDLICQKSGIIIFVEVKTRRNTEAGWPEEAVTPEKIRKIAVAGQLYLLENKINANWQIDVISIFLNEKNKPMEMKHFKNVS